MIGPFEKEIAKLKADKAQLRQMAASYEEHCRINAQAVHRLGDTVRSLKELLQKAQQTLVAYEMGVTKPHSDASLQLYEEIYQALRGPTKKGEE